MSRSGVAVLAAVTLSGCFSSTHVPRDRRKVYHVVQDNRRGYQRDGVFYGEAGFGGGLLEAVAGNPEAEGAADEFRDRMIGGFLATMAGLVCVPAILSYDIARAANSNSGFPASHGYAMIGCGVLALVGTGYLISAIPYQLDAVNIYNDAVDARSIPWPPPPQFAPPPLAPPPPAPPGIPVPPAATP